MKIFRPVSRTSGLVPGNLNRGADHGNYAGAECPYNMVIHAWIMGIMTDAGKIYLLNIFIQPSPT
ncbi:MAG: hypothetical protein WCO00_14635 [Rhodospirillaceae bacterium]